MKRFFERYAAVIVSMLVVLLLAGCGAKKDKESGIPLDEDGIPKCNVVSLNQVLKEFSYETGEDGPAEDTVEFGLGVEEDTITIFLAEGLPIHEWIAEDNVSGMELKEQEIYHCSATQSELEGLSQDIQKFVYKVTDNEEVEKLVLYKKNKDNGEQIFELTIRFATK